jgi:HIT domain
VISFRDSIDILPLRKGHTLVIPKIHQSRISELPPDYAASVGEAVSKVADALTKSMYTKHYGVLLCRSAICSATLIHSHGSLVALQNSALNVVCNQEYAQAVPHVRTFPSSNSKS